MQNHSVTSVSSPVDKAQPTPGPWRVNPEAYNEYWVARGHIMYDAEGGKKICDIVMPDSPEGKANAALIASAPDLLDALCDMIDDNDNSGIGITMASINKARAAITKAKGQA